MTVNWEQLSGGNYLEGNYPGVIIQWTIMKAQIVWGQFSGGNCPGGNYPGGQFSGWQLVWGGGQYLRAIVWGAIVLD